MLDGLAQQNAAAGATLVVSSEIVELGTGQSVETASQLDTGKCYTAVAAALPDVAEVNLRLEGITAGDGGPLVLAVDPDTGATATVGKTPNCYQNASPIAVPVKLVARVEAGSGYVGARLYQAP